MNLTDDDRQWIRDLFRQELQRFATKDDLESVETKLLTAFHEWASPMDARVRSHSAILRALDEDLEYFKRRVEKLEQK